MPLFSGPDFEIGSCLRDSLASRGPERFLELSACLQLRCWVEDSIYRFLIFVRGNQESIYGVFASPWHGRFFCSVSKLHSQGLSNTFDVFRMMRADELPRGNCISLPWGDAPASSTCNFTAHARTRQTNSASDCGVGSSAVETEKNGRLQGCQLACPIPLSVLDHPLVRLRLLRADRDLHRSRASLTLERENNPTFATSSRKYP